MLLGLIVIVWFVVAAVLNYIDLKIEHSLFNGFSFVWLIWPALLTAYLMGLLYQLTTGEKSPWTDDE